MIVHIVLFKFNDENKDQNIKKTVQLLQQLPNKIKQLKTLEIGVNFDEAPRAMDLSIYTKFDSKEDLDIYANDEYHLEVIEYIKSVTSYTKVCDYII